MKYFLPTYEKIYILGRTVMRCPLPLFWTASGVELTTNSTELWFDLESVYTLHEEWICIEIDGCCIQRMMVPKGRTRICAFRSFPSNVKRTVRLLKEVQPMREDEEKCLLVHGVECNGELFDIPEKRCRIEFIGDSLSSGEGLGGYVGLLGAGSAMFGIQGNYALKVSEFFQADFRILSQSGWGVYSSCYNDLIRVMPKYYEQICGVVTGIHNEKLGAFERNDFVKWQPDVVVINLGSNDGFALDRDGWLNPEDGQVYRQVTNSYGGVEEQSALRFEQAVVDFLRTLRALNPDAYLLWAYGMCDHTMAPYLDNAVRRYVAETQDDKVSFQILPATTQLWVGSSNHPGRIAHDFAAKVLIDKVGEILSGK